MDFNWGVFGLAIAILCIGGILGYWVAPSEIIGLNETEVDAKIADAVNQSVFQKNAQIKILEGFVEELENKTAEEEIIEVEGYVLDGLFLEVLVDETLSDREVSLFDGEIEFDGKDYDAEEIFTLSNFELRANDNDFEGIPYLVVPDGAIRFEFVFDKDLNTSLIGDEDYGTLSFSLFGEEVEISKWDGNEITFTKGTQKMLKEGESITINEKTILLEFVSEESVWVDVDGVGAKIKDGRTKTINGIEIKVQDIFEGSSARLGFATLIIGEEVEITVSNGKDYEEDSIWEWIITENSIGLVLVEEFTELDENYNALASEESICLPNDYLCVVYNGVIEEDSEKYTFELEGDFVEVEGKFLYEIEDYDKIYIHKNGSIYEDDNTDDYIGEKIQLGDSDLVISASEQWNRILIEDSVSGDLLVWIKLNLTEILVDRNDGNFSDWTNITSEDEDYLTNYGILVENPEDSIEDQEFRITVPEEKLEATITVK